MFAGFGSVPGDSRCLPGFSLSLGTVDVCAV